LCVTAYLSKKNLTPIKFCQQISQNVLNDSQSSGTMMESMAMKKYITELFMKKLVSLLLAVWMCLSVGAMLTACGEEKHVHTQLLVY